MASTSEHSVTILIRTWTFMVIFYFAGCAAGSCLSYGHSCWGAHGKRSGGHTNNAYLVASKPNIDVQQDAPSFAKEQWVVSRLIGRPLTSNKYRGRWDRLYKLKTNYPQHWDGGELNTHIISDGPVRDQSNNNDEANDGKKRNVNDIQDIMNSMNDEHKEIPEILLISSNDNNDHGSKSQNVELYKFLNDLNDNFE